MAKNGSEYRRLTGNRRGMMRWHSLWLGKDHILAVESTGYTEEYRRYYFRDIQGIVTRRTRRREWLAALLALPVLLFAFLAFGAGVSNEMPETIALAVTAAAFLVILLIHLFRGPSCRTWIQMPLTVDELPSLARLPKVRKVMETIRPLIASAQGSLRPSEIVARAAEELPVPPPIRPVQPEKRAPRELKTGYDGRIHRFFFVLVLADAVVTGLSLPFSDRMEAAAAIITLLLFGFMVAALVKQQAYVVPKSARTLVWVCGGMMIGIMAVGVIYVFYDFFSTFASGNMKAQPNFRLEPLDHPFLVGLYLFNVLFSLYAGFSGLAAMGEQGRNGGAA